MEKQTYHKCDKCERILLTCEEIEVRRCETCRNPALRTEEEHSYYKKWEKIYYYSMGFLMGALATIIYALLKMLV